MNRSQETIARLLEGLGRGDRTAVDELFAKVYDELKGLAHRQRARWSQDYTMNTTALVHEVYVKLVGQSKIDTDGRAHFQALAARAMRHVLCNYARERGALKRGGGLERVQVDDGGDGLDRLEASGTPTTKVGSENLLCDLDRALTELERSRPRASRVVECRFFGGMTVEETAAAVGASQRSVKRDWAMAQAWLHRALAASDSDTEAPGDE